MNCLVRSAGWGTGWSRDAPPQHAASAEPAGSTEKGCSDVTWNKPRVVEISIAMEVNCYACADS